MKTKILIFLLSAFAISEALAQVKTDVAGIELGMSPAQARSAAHAISKSYVLTDLVYPDTGKPAGFKGGVKIPGSSFSSEAVAVQFSEQGQKVISVSRHITYVSAATKPTTRGLVNSIIEKYGKPSKIESTVHGVTLIWQYSKNNELQNLSAGINADPCDHGGNNYIVEGLPLTLPNKFGAGCGIRVSAYVNATGEMGNDGKPNLFATSLLVSSVDIPTAYAELHQEHDAMRKAKSEDLQRRIQNGDAVKPKL